MNVADFFDMLRRQGFTTGEIFAVIAYTTVDVEKVTRKQLVKFIPGFRILLEKMVQHEQILDDIFNIKEEPEE